MKKRLLRILIIVVVVYSFLLVWRSGSNHASEGDKKLNQTDFLEILRDGDIIFHESLSQQSKAIQLATESPYSHCGIIYKTNNGLYVLEAIQTVELTPLKQWIARGTNGHFVVKRLKNADEVLTSHRLIKMKEIGNRFKGKTYDLTFEWSDDKIYCSELVWKIYERATGVKLGELQRLGDFNLTHQAVKEKMDERYGNEIPFDEPVIAPVTIFNSQLLETVYSN